jgi:AraC-like DNA-binding protein
LLGPSLPHYWTYDESFRSENGDGKVVIIHFEKDFAGSNFLSKPETKPIIDLLDKSYRGLKILGKCKTSIIDELLNIEKEHPLKQLVTLINILTELSFSTEVQFLAGQAYKHHKKSEQELRIKRILNFISANFYDSELCLEKMAKMASMSTSSFSKYFKKQTGQNYIEVLSSLRLSEACKLLGASDYSIAQIAYRCGYNNLSNFNKHFKLRYKCTPKAFANKVNI